MATLRGGARAALARLDEVDAAVAARAAHEERVARELLGGIGRAEEACRSLELAVGGIWSRVARLLGPGGEVQVDDTILEVSAPFAESALPSFSLVKGSKSGHAAGASRGAAARACRTLRVSPAPYIVGSSAHLDRILAFP